MQCSLILNNKKFALRGGAEHRNLRLSQVVKNMSANGKICYAYTEHSFKNRAGVFNQLYVLPKVVQQHKDVDAGERCHVAILDKYLSLLLEKAKKEDVFYLRPLDKYPKEGPVWFSS